MQVYLFNTYSNFLWPRQVCKEVIFYDQDRYVMKLFSLEMGSTVFKVRCISNKIGTQITPFFICSAWLCVKVWEKIIAR